MSGRRARTFDLTLPTAGDGLGVDILFGVTRSVLHRIETEEIRLSGLTTGVTADVDPSQTIDGLHAHVPSSAFGVLGDSGLRAAGRQVRIHYEGEPLQLLAVRTRDAMSAEVTWETSVRRWTACRDLHASTDPEYAFFWEIDRHTHRHALSTPSEMIEPLEKLGSRLYSRIVARAQMANPRFRPTPLGDHRLAAEYTANVLAEAGGALSSGDGESVWGACCKFASGWLGKPCSPIEGVTTVAGDTDSDAVFLFAEFLLGVADQAERDASWSPIAGRVRHLLGPFAMMQRIYLERWRQAVPHGMSCFDRPVNRLRGDLREFVRRYQGQSDTALADLILGNLLDLKRLSSCFPPEA